MGRARAELALLALPTSRASHCRPVYVVEGEKDADTLARLGLAATCNVEGAAAPGQRSKWLPAYTPGRSVAAGRRGGTGAEPEPRSPGERHGPAELRAIRQWARDQGLSVSDRGRIAANIVARYHAAH